MAAPDHAHDLEALDRSVSGLHRLEAPGGTDQPFERTMIGLDPVVEVLRRDCCINGGEPESARSAAGIRRRDRRAC